MKKSSKPVLAVGLILAGLVCILAISLLAGSPAWAAQPTGKTGSTQGAIVSPTPSQSAQSAPSPITPYVAQAYSIVGPINVYSVSARDIVLYTGANNLGIDLAGKNVTVIDQNSRSLSLSAVQKGTRVYVCRKDNNVVVVVLPDIAATGGAKQ
jgi:hypothetical protein